MKAITLYLKVEDGESIGHVFVKIPEQYFETNFIVEAFVQPAFEQAVREMRYAKERQSA